MPLEGPARKLFEEIKYEHGFPPRSDAMKVKNELATRGLGNSSMLAQQIVFAYLRVVERVLDGFTDRALASGAALGLTSAAAIRDAVFAAHEELFNIARGLVRDEVGGSDYGNLAMGMVDDKRRPVLDHLQRKIDLREIESTPPRPTKESDQKVGILLSHGQAERDFDDQVQAGKKVGNPVALVFLDLDNFKQLNNRFTNAKVDETILPEAQRLLAKLVQGRGEAYRHGGDEFVLITPNLEEDEAKGFAEKVRRSFEDQDFAVDGETVVVTVSVGVAVWPVHGSTYREILEAANRAQVDAKETRNTVVVARPGVATRQ